MASCQSLQASQTKLQNIVPLSLHNILTHKFAQHRLAPVSLARAKEGLADGASDGLAARHLNRPSSLQFEEAFGSTWLRYALLSQ